MTQNLSALRVSYAKLLDEHGTTTALLHQRELELERRKTRDLQEAQRERDKEYQKLKARAPFSRFAYSLPIHLL